MGSPAVIVSVEKQPNVDTIALTHEIEAALQALGPSLPAGIKADNILFRQAEFIETSVKNVEHVLLEAIVAVALVLFAFLLNTRTTAISLTAIPVSILVAAIVFRFMGLSINTMTLGGLAIAIGELVDDAVVDVENIYRRLRENRQAAHPKSAFDVIVAASQECVRASSTPRRSSCSSSCRCSRFQASKAGFSPPLAKPISSRFWPASSSRSRSTPVLAYYLLPRQKNLDQQEGGMVRALKRYYRAGLLRALDHGPVVASLVAIAVITAGVGAFSLPRAFLPPFNEGTLTINALFNPGISLAESNRVGLIAEKLLLEVSEVKSVGRRTGRAELDEHAEGVHSSEIEVDLAESGRKRDDVVADIRARLNVLPMTINVGQPISHRLDHMLSGVPPRSP